MENNKFKFNQREYKVLYKRIIYTCFILFVYIFGTHLTFTSDYSSSDKVIKLPDLLSSTLGGNFETMNLFSLGVGPWLTAMILITLYTYRDPDKLMKQTRRQKHYKEKGLALIIALIQGFYLVKKFMRNGDLEQSEFWLSLLLLVTGAMLLIWLADQNSQNGIGGPMPIVMIGLVRALLDHSYGDLFSNQLMMILVIVMLVLSFFILMILELTEYRLDYVEIMNISQQYNRTYLAWKPNPAGSISIMISISFFTVIRHIFKILDEFVLNGDYEVYNFFTFNNGIGISVYLFLQFSLNYLLSRFLLNTSKKAEEFQKSGNFFEGIFPGEPTEKYLSRRASWVSLIGSSVITSMLAVPLIISLFIPEFSQEMSLTVQLIILVYISLNLTETIKAYLYFDEYDQFLSKYWTGVKR